MKTVLKKTLCLVFAMCIALFALTACGGGDETTSSAPSNGGSSSNSGEVIANKPSNVEGTQWQDFDPYATISDSIKGSTVRFATWGDEYASEGGNALNKFEADTGLKVELFTVPQSGYVSTIMSKMAAGDIPDVFVNNEGSGGNFPITLQIAAPINKVSTVNLQEPIWDQSMLAQGTIDGNVYLVNTIGTPWTGSNLVFYNKAVFGNNGFKTPVEYYEEGKWTWDNFLKCAKDLQALGDDYVGAYVDPNMVAETMNASFVKYDAKTGTFSSGINDKNLLKAYEWYAEANEEGLLDGSVKLFQQGKCALCVTGTYGLKKTGYWRDMNPEDIGYTYLPSMEEGEKPLISAAPRFYGIVEKAPNADAAGYFLRHWLDPDNYDLSTTFLTTEAGQFYYTLTNTEASQKHFDYTQAVVLADGGNAKNEIYKVLNKESPAGIKTALDSFSNKIDKAVAAANGLVKSKVEADRLKYN